MWGDGQSGTAPQARHCGLQALGVLASGVGAQQQTGSGTSGCRPGRTYEDDGRRALCSHSKQRPHLPAAL